MTAHRTIALGDPVFKNRYVLHLEIYMACKLLIILRMRGTMPSKQPSTNIIVIQWRTLMHAPLQG